MTTRTRTYARMPISRDAYNEILTQMVQAGYIDQVHYGNLQMDMDGIRLELDTDSKSRAREWDPDDERRERIATAALSALLSRDQNHPSLGEAINRAARAADQLIEELGE